MSFTFIDISDMFFYLGHHRNVSGIQRTQSNLVRSVCLANQDFSDVHFVSLNRDRSRYQLLDKSALVGLMFGISDMETDHDVIKSAIHDLTIGGLHPQFRPGDVFIVTGAFWIFNDVYHLYNNLKSLDVVMGCYVYDLIPINQPDFCTSDLTAAFTSAFNHAGHFFDFMMTISDHTKAEVDAYLRSSGLPETVTATVRLAHTMNDHPPSGDGFDLGGLKFNDFVLCVGTIEARKNHQLLYQVWKLLAEAGVTPMPKLVIAGRWGWRVDDLRAQLSATNGLDGSIVVLTDVDDETLELLYRECKFTIFPSFVEGWGMPVGESLVHGRFCLASRASSIPEVGGRFVDYIDPYNAREAFEMVCKYLVHPGLLEGKHEIIRSQFVARTWSEFRNDFIATASRSAKQVTTKRKRPVYPIMGLRDSIDASNNHASASVKFPRIDPELTFAEGWDVAENLGRWMRSRTAKLLFYIDTEDDRFKIGLKLFSVPWAFNNVLKIFCCECIIERQVPSGSVFFVTLSLDRSLSPSSLIEIDFQMVGEYDYTLDPRDLCVGLSSVEISAM